jgi:N-acyl-phosphatidylethanolamine-hydrolysing phospholipase D
MMNRRRFLAAFGATLVTLGLARWLRPPAGAAGTLVAPPRRQADLPAHHNPEGGFINPWPTAEREESGGFLRWQLERMSNPRPPNPSADAFPFAEPAINYSRAEADEIRITWIGHATFLIQAAGLNILTDPQWSRRASPVQFAGPARLVPPSLPLERLPPVDAVLVSHDHYDHLDSGTVERLDAAFGDRLRWFAPLGHGAWFEARGIRSATDMDWWDEATLDGPHGTVRIVALPCQHWTSRTPFDRQRRLWASFAIVLPDGRSIYFGGDSAYFPEFPAIHDRLGSFDALLVPIGAYEPRWFMKPVHMNPEEAVQAYRDLGGTGTMIGMHWGTFRLTDEDPLEPPVKTREAWQEAGLPPGDLCLPRHGETVVVRGGQGEP